MSANALVSQRVPAALKRRIRAIEQRYGVGEARLVRDAIAALCICVEESGSYTRPLAAIPADRLAALSGGLDKTLQRILLRTQAEEGGGTAETQMLNEPKAPLPGPAAVMQQADYRLHKAAREKAARSAHSGRK